MISTDKKTKKSMIISWQCLLIIVVFLSGCIATENKQYIVLSERSEHDPYWRGAQIELQKRLAITRANHKANNVILFVADGMGVSTVTAARIYDGQSKGHSGEENTLSFEQFPHVALVKTYNSNSQVPDSAGTASALNTGVKTKRGAINTWADQAWNECYGPSKHFPASLAEMAEQQGLSTGLISTSRITHATPAAVYGHSPSRQWEDDTKLPELARKVGCIDLARQMLEFNHGDGLDVMFGGGRQQFLQHSDGGVRNDNLRLIEQWQQRYPGATYIDNVADFRSMAATETQRVLGLFSNSHMAYEADRDNTKEPSLPEMTASAIDILSRNDKGYFLMVESGRVDHAHHQNNAYRALSDTQAFAKAVQTAVDKVDLKNTLILVTADHSHLLTIAGYPERGNPILGLVYGQDSKTEKTSQNAATLDDGKPYTTLGYHIGSHVRQTDASALNQQQVTHPDYRQQAAIKNATGGYHSGEDVALYALGAQSHLVGGVIEQHTIFHIMTYALGWQF